MAKPKVVVEYPTGEARQAVRRTGWLAVSTCAHSIFSGLHSMNLLLLLFLLLLQAKEEKEMEARQWDDWKVREGTSH